MSELSFLSPDEARAENGFEPRAASPLARALAGADGIGDLSLLGKLEVRGPLSAIDADADVISITPHRAIVICDAGRVSVLRKSLPGMVVDVTAALAGIEVEGETLMSRLTDLALDRLPAAGKVADVPALVSRDGARFRIFFPQEYGDSVVETVRDAQDGVR
jgi:hypothetical protein